MKKTLSKTKQWKTPWNFSRASLFAFFGMLLSLTFANAQTPFTTQNVVVLQVGDGSAALTGSSTPVSLQEYTTLGAFVNAHAIPSVGSPKLTMSGTGSSEGQITRSADYSSIVLAGYDVIPGQQSSGSASNLVPRVIGTMDATGTYSSTLSSSNYFSGNAFRSAAADCNNYWGTGTGVSSGINYFGNGPADNVSLTVTNTRVANVYNGQLYFSTGNTFFGIYKVGTGTPTSAGNTSTVEINTGNGSSPYAFAFNAAGNLCYIADARTNGSGGVQKWVYSAGSWSLAYTLSVGANKGAVGLTVDFTNDPIIYATTTTSISSQLVSIVDNGAGSPFAVLATAPANTLFRGVAFAPIPPPAVNPTSNSPICPGATLELHANATGGPVLTYQWSGVGTFNPSTTVSDPTVTGAATGLYSVTVSNGCVSTTGSVSITVYDIDDNNVCTTDGCDPQSGPTHTPISVDDNDVCTTDACDPITGPSHTPINIDDNNVCTTEICDPIIGAIYTPISVDDQDVCTTDACDPITGPSHTPVDINDNNACTADACDPVDGISHTPINFNDQNPCTIDACDPLTGISHTPIANIGGGVDDGLVCTSDDCIITGTPLYFQDWETSNAGWGSANLSVPLGAGNWGVTASTNAWSAYSGTNWAFSQFNAGAGLATISNWLFAPTTTMNNGDVISFFTRTRDVVDFPDRLQVRMSTNGASTNVGATATSVGDFTTLLLDINPTYNFVDYPNDWTQFSVTISGLAGPTSGKIAFRYFVEDGGPSGANSDLIGLEDVLYLTSLTGSTAHNPVNVDDNDVCTTDGCVEPTGVFHTPISVDDNDVCTTDACDPLTGPSHTPISVDDNDVCTTDACDPITGPSHTPISVDDNDVCTTDACDPITGPSHTPISVDDNDVCTTDACDPITGPSHTPISVDDQDVCTTDACDPITGPSHTPISVDDQNVCTTDACDPITGPSHTPISVDDQDVCTTDACDPITGPSHTPVDINDNNACTADACDPVDGISHTPINFNDQNPCTIDACDPLTGISHTPIANIGGGVDDGLVCTSDDCIITGTPLYFQDWETSNAGWGSANLSVPLGAGNWGVTASTNAWSAYSGTNWAFSQFNAGAGLATISNWLFAPTTTMNNGDVISFFTRTRDVVDFPDRLQVRMSTNGASTNVGATATSVGDFTTLLLDINPTYNFVDYPNDWTQFSVTISGLAGPTSGKIAFRYFVEDGGPSGANSDLIGLEDVLYLTSLTGSTAHNPVNVDDNDVCTTDGCVEPTGVFHTPISVDDNDVCTTDACDPLTGPSHTPISVDDNDVCTTDACDPITGPSHTPISVDDNDVCTTDACDPITGPSHTPISVDDNDVCTTDACDPITGPSHTPISVDDQDVCTTDACDPITGPSHTPISVDDQNVCTTDACDPITGPSHTPISVDDNNVCTDDFCDPITGVYHTPIGGVTTTHSSGAVNIPVPDNNTTGISSTIVVSGAASVSSANDMTVAIDIINGHTWAGDVEVTLTTPGGNTIVFDRPGVPAVSGVGNSMNLTGIYSFNPSAAGILPQVSAGTNVTIPNGTYQPSNSANPDAAHNWAGITFPFNPNGNWIITLRDLAGDDFGTLASWNIVLSSSGGIDDNNVCTIDACDPITGVSHTPISVDDNDVCTTDACDPITGPSHTPISVDDNDVCTTDACDPITGPSHTPISVDDNDVCTTDACDPITGPSHTPISVDDQNVCTTDACDPITGPSHTPINVDDNNPCTNDYCDPLTGPYYTPNPPVAGPISGGPAVQCVPNVAGGASFSIAPIPGVNYFWSVPAGMTIAVGQFTNAIYVVWPANTINKGIIGPLCVTISNNCGSDQECIDIDIQSVKPGQPNSVSGPTKACPGDDVNYSIAPVQRASSYVWTVPAGVTINTGQGTTMISVSYDGAFVGGTITVAAANACGVGNARPRAVILNNPTTPGAIAGQAYGLCNLSGAGYSIAAVPNAVSYQWSVTGGSIVGGSTGLSISVDWGALTSGTVSVVSINACGTSAPRVLNVSGIPGIFCNITGPNPACTNATSTYLLCTSVGATNYIWASSIGTELAPFGDKIFDVAFDAIPATNQIITVRAQNACGISAFRTFSNLSTAFCPRLADSGSASGLAVYPNPAKNKVNVSFNGTIGTQYSINIIDVTGRIVWNINDVSVEGLNQREIDLNTVSSGVYFVMIQSANATEQVRLVVE